MAISVATVVTALEHDPIPITRVGSAWSITSAEANRLALIGELRPGFCELGYQRVKLAQYCGVVSMGDRILEILPKIHSVHGSVHECRGVLLRLLRMAERVSAFRHDSAGQDLWRSPLLEVFIAAYFDTVTTVVRGGLLKKYEERNEDLDVVRGRIVLSRQFGAHANRPDRLACSFDDLTADNVWNRVLKKAIRVTRPWIRNEGLNRRWLELMGLFDEVDDGVLTKVELSRLAFDRQAERYRESIQWARWILSLLSPSLRAGADEAPALLFDMNRLFEKAIASLLKRRAVGSPNIRVLTQNSSASLAQVVSGGRLEPAFALKPDLVIKEGNEIVAIGDTKWKRIDVDRRGRLIPSEADMYQMHAYATAYKCNDLALIYPWRAELGGSQETRFELHGANGSPASVRVICVSLESDHFPAMRGANGGRIGPLLRSA